jgi:guanylate cyclase
VNKIFTDKASEFLSRLLRPLSRLGASSGDSADERVKKSIVVVSSFGTVAIVFLYWAPMLYYYGEYLLFAIYLGFAGILMVNTAIFARWHKNLYWYAGITLGTALAVQYAAAILVGGVVNQIGAMLWCLVITLAALIIYSPRQALGWYAAFVSGILMIILLQPYLKPESSYPPQTTWLTMGLNILFVSMFIFGTFAYFVSQRELAFRLLRSEQAKSEGLLLNILPEDIAAQLKDERRTIAEQYPCASILFADVVGFTPMSASMTPQELIELLNDVFSYFDSLVDRYDLEKIKTIGDCYMAAAGLPRPRPDHAQVLARMALEAQAYIAGHEFCKRRLAFRIGINSGPVVAGVIGQKKFSYDLWGDAVNTASRMESHGAEGSIQITRATYELIQDDFTCEPRGKVNVKGKGDMEVWHLVGVKARQ